MAHSKPVDRVIADRRLLVVICECGRGERPSDNAAAATALMLGLLARVDNRLWPTYLGFQALRDADQRGA